MKTQDILLIGLAGLAAYLILKPKTAEAQTPLQLITGGGGSGGGGLPALNLSFPQAASSGLDSLGLAGILGSFQSGLAGMMGNLGSQGNQGGLSISWDDLRAGLGIGGTDGAALNLGGIGDLNKYITDFIKGLGVGGGNGGGIKIPDTTDVTKIITDPFKGITDPWAGALDPFKKVSTNLASTVKSTGTIVESVSMVPRVITGALKNAMTGNVAGGSWTGILAPGVAIVSGAVREMQQIATEKNPAMQYTVGIGSGIAARYGLKPGQAATAAATKQAVAQAQAIMLKEKAGTPQQKAMAKEVPLGKTPEAPSAPEAKLTNAQTAALLNKRYAIV